MKTEYLNMLKEQFNNRISFREKRPGILQLFAPFYHEDGDMVEIYLQESPDDPKKIRIADYGMTIMRLSYCYQIDTPNKEKILQTMVSENSLSLDNGNIYLDTDSSFLYTSVMQYAQSVSKISGMRHFGREAVRSLFYETFREFTSVNLKKFNPIADYFPIPERDDLEVDFSLPAKTPFYIFAVKDVAKARLTAIYCLEFQKAKLPFKSIVVHENFEGLPRKDQTRLTSAADKQFVNLEDYEEQIEAYLERAAT